MVQGYLPKECRLNVAEMNQQGPTNNPRNEPEIIQKRVWLLLFHLRKRLFELVNLFVSFLSEPSGALELENQANTI